MGIVTTHTEGRVVTHSTDDAGSIEVVQLPNRDVAVQADDETAEALQARLEARGDSNPDVAPTVNTATKGAAMRAKPKATKPAKAAKAPAKKRR